ncbi:hypothetical protein MN188_04030 [Aliiroseovarius sp. N1Y82]|uniref:hypothetical protein n=1 Tax=Aliiroseovarius subalbicans TaxID=2925840 RepID=UPI001F58ACF7|nr:hypothetical protein [Aliiroseovarius subalbicans]MCI2398555.1 hypothetical protein [Aliiroseovarius subalbicans]
MTCCNECKDRKEMVEAASEWMNGVRTGQTRSVTLYFDDGHVATGRFNGLHDGFFTFSNERNPGPRPGNSSDTAWRREDHPYCNVKRIRRDYYKEYGSDRQYGE